jgi:cyclopropane fatty-acyl-phospholipid synthase-like methyltransferase
MKISKKDLSELVNNKAFPLSSKYDPIWILENEMGINALWLTEWLCRNIELKPGMRILDIGCGKVMSSVFLAKEYDVMVFASDPLISATENWQRIKTERLENKIFPIRAEAHDLPFAEDFFDIIIGISSYQIFGTDDLYLEYILSFLKPDGKIGIVVPGLMKEFKNGLIPKHFTQKQANGGVFWELPRCACYHTVNWWRNHWEKMRLVDIEKADTLKDGCKLCVQFQRARNAFGMNTKFPDDIETLTKDDGRYLGLIRLIASKK